MMASSSEFVAVILAATVGHRLFPLTNQNPKHVLPLAGISGITRLVAAVLESGFTECILVLTGQDEITLPKLQEEWSFVMEDSTLTAVIGIDQQHFQIRNEDNDKTLMNFRTLRLGGSSTADSTAGSLLVLQQIAISNNIVSPTSNLVMIPGDLVVLNGANPLQQVTHAHRQEPTAAATVLITRVGQSDENGVPLKESAKAKTGRGWARDEEEVEYMALGYSHKDDNTAPPRLVWKQAKLDVEENKDMLGTSPKLDMPKQRLRNLARLSISSSLWHDNHVYALRPWVWQQLCTKPNLYSIAGDLIPLLIARQFRGKRATIGSSGAELKNATHTSESSASTANDDDDDEYQVLAVVAKPENDDDAPPPVLRANTIPAYLYANDQLAKLACRPGGSSVKLPPHTSIRDKMQSLLFSPADATSIINSIGQKVNLKHAIVGPGCVVSQKCRLNHVVLHSQAKLGDNSILQNSIVGAQAVIGENCNLNDCQVEAHAIVPTGTKTKSESFVAAAAPTTAAAAAAAAAS